MRPPQLVLPIILILTLPAVLPSQTLQSRSGVTLEHDSTDSITITAGEEIEFELRAMSENGSVVSDWNYIGRNVTLTVSGSHAEADTNMQSWDEDPDNYSWMHISLNHSLLVADSIHIADTEMLQYFTIPKTAFSEGQAFLHFAQSGVDNDIRFSITPTWTFLRQESPPIAIVPAKHDNYLVDLTRPVPDSSMVFVKRSYEIVVVPRDRYGNIIDDEEIPTLFTARFQDEFRYDYPGLDPVFTEEALPIHGIRSFLLFSSHERYSGNMQGQFEEPQWIHARLENDSSVSGRSIPYEILGHPPNPFALIDPPTESRLELQAASSTQEFLWERAVPVDPYTNIIVRRNDSVAVSDDVRYYLRFLDAVSLTRGIDFLSSNYGRDARAVLTH